MNFKSRESKEKLRGGYYTPPDLVDFLVRWVSTQNPNAILEPSCGDGAFFNAIKEQCDDAQTFAIEFDKLEAIKSRQRANELDLTNVTVSNCDFLAWALNAMHSEVKFDAVVGNPPFIRYQYLPSEFQLRAKQIFEVLECKFTKHTNAWVPFMLASFNLLKPRGRLAMVVPSEIIHVTHAQSLRNYLGEHAGKVVVIDPKELWFDGTLQGAVLLMAERKASDLEKSHGLGIHSVKGRSFTHDDPEEIFQATGSINGKTIDGKWTRALLPAKTRSLVDSLEDHKSIRRFSQVADVDVGIVTGANKFFLVNDEIVNQYRLKQWAYPMFGRSEHCPGIIYDKRQHLENALSGKPTNFLWLQGKKIEKSKGGRRYIEYGMQQNLHTRYKCRVRNPWYTVPSVYSTDVGMLKRSHDTPRLILNQIRAYTTDTAYRIRICEGTPEQLVFGFMNGLTAVSAELEGRHYGGGVLELIPSEIEQLLLPSPSTIEPNIPVLDKKVRTKSIPEVLKSQSEQILGPIGLSKNDQIELLSGWYGLRNRRMRISAELPI